MTFFGLSEREAEASRQKHGLNEILYKPSFGKSLLRGLNGLSCKLFSAAALAEIIGVLLGLITKAGFSADFSKAVLFLCAAVFCALFEAVLSFRAETVLNGSQCGLYTVFRENGKTQSVPRNMLAVGDAVFLSAGDEIPADGSVAEGTLTVDQSALGVIGKAEKTAPPQNMRTGGTLGLNNPYFLFKGSVVCGGSGIMRITAVGRNTRIAEKNAAESLKPAEIRSEKFEKAVRTGAAAGIIAALSALTYKLVGGCVSGEAIAGLAQGISGAAAVLAVSCFCGKNLICESAAAAAVKRLEKNGVSVMNPGALSKSSETGIVLIDRAGILAEAEYSSKGLTFIDGNGKEYDSFKKLNSRLAEVFKNAAACTSDAVVTADGAALGGSPLDRAVLSFIGKKAGTAAEIKIQAEVRAEVDSFLSGTTVTVGGKLLTFVRGGSEILLDRCSDVIGENGKRQKITNKSALQKLSSAISLTGKDVIALAVSERGIKGGRLPSGGYALIGLISLYDSFFDCAADEVKRLEKAGVKTMLITGQSRESAIFAARLAGIKKSTGIVLDSEQLAKMSDKELSDKFEDVKAVVRAVPADRRRIIRAAHEKGLKVCAAVSGLKAAKAASDAEMRLAAPGCATAVRTVSDAAAEGCGIKAAADIVSCSARYAADCRAAAAVRAVCAVIAAAAFIFF